MKVYSLSIHADYKCRHSGACCSADWDVPVELPIYRTLHDALEGGRIHPAATADDSPLVTEPDLPDDAAAMLGRTNTGECVFFDRGSHLCIVHRDLGEPALPSTCRHFPRVAVSDWRGTFITLSHFCPTAASMLFRDVPLEIVEAPPAFPAADYQGLAVRADAWPPLLHRRMLMDLEGYTAWERHMVRRCSDVTRLPESVVATLARDATMLQAWMPGASTLTEAVAALPPAWIDAGMPRSLDASLAMRSEVLIAVPDDLIPAPDDDGLGQAYEAFVRPSWMDCRGPIDRFLAAKAFASWTAYQGNGIRSIVRGLEAALAIVRVEAARQCRDAGRAVDADLLREAIRSADLLLNHLAVGEDLARIFSRAENR